MTSLTGSAVACRKTWTASATVTLAATNTTPRGAVVTFSLSGGATGTTSCTTGAYGSCTASVSVPNKRTSVTLTVTGVAKPGATFDRTGQSQVTVTKP